MEEDMNLIDAFMTECTFITKTKVSDGEGGSIDTWKDGIKFQAAITHNNTIEAKIAEKQGVTSVYLVTTPNNIKLEYHEVFRREKDGKIFRVTSDGEDVVSPAMASFQISQVTAEEWRLPL
jgi:SPP1 family predicted phage head-tail adaptor